MKHALLATAALLALAGTAHAADPYASWYGNTLTITGSDGSKLTVFVNADMSYEQHFANGAVEKGTYAWKDASTACYTQVDPAPSSPDKATNCFPDQVAHNVGDTWTTQMPDGKTYSLTLTAGR